MHYRVPFTFIVTVMIEKTFLRFSRIHIPIAFDRYPYSVTVALG